MPVKSDVPQGSVLGLVLFNIFIKSIDSKIECILTKFTVDIKLSGIVNTLEGRDILHRDLDKLEKYTHVNLTRVNKAKYKVLCLGRGNPLYQYSLGNEGLESSPAKKDLGMLVHETTKQQRALTAQKANRILGCIKNRVASR